jgi:hypothetical protein
MSYPAACNTLSRRANELKELIDQLRLAGVNVNEIMKLFDGNKYNELIEYISAHQEYSSLQDSANNLKGSYENMLEELREWNKINYYESPESSPSPMYGGLSDDWEEYLDMIGHDKYYD